MAKNRFYARVSRVENFIVMLLTRYSVSANIFTDMLPVTIKSEWNDMVLVDVGKGTGDNAKETYSANIFLYGRPLDDLQSKSVRVIDKMEEVVYKAISECHDSHYHLSLNWSDSGYDSTRNFHFNVLNVSIVITEN